jgi:ABC-2 type transport system permease protein
MQTFKTLLEREWMQHRFGWLLLGGVPFAIMVPLMSFGTIQFGDGSPPPPGMVTLIVAMGYIFFLLVLAGGAVAIQTPGLARRDWQDRSVEFWLSLPVGHTQAVGATVLMHLLVMPLLLLGLAAAGSPIAGLIAEARVNGVASFAQVPWATVVTVFVAGIARLALGLVLAALWLSPLLLGAMAASAWLKRWGVPVLAAVLGLGGLILAKGYDQPIVLDVIGAVIRNAGRAVAPMILDDKAAPALANLPGMLGRDALGALGDLSQPLFAGGLVVAAACFALLVWRRARA